MFYLRLIAALLAFTAASLRAVGAALVRRDRRAVAYDYAQWVAAWVQPPLALRVRVVNAGRLAAYRPCVYVGNHQSLLDVPVLASCFVSGGVVIGKKELSKIPLFGWIFDATGQIRIDRGDTQQAVGRLKHAEEQIRARRVGVWIFPEGTRGGEPGEMLPFKKGAFVMAVNTAAPLVPVVVSPYKPRSDIKARRLLPNDVEVRVLEPIPTAGLTEADVPELMERTRRGMASALAALSAERGVTPATPHQP